MGQGFSSHLLEESIMANPTSGTRNQGEERSVGQTASDLKNKAKDVAGNVADKAKDMASSVVEQARDTAANLGRTASNVASNLGERAGEATSNVAGGIRNLAGTIRDKGPHEGVMGTANASVANALDSSGRYLQEHGLNDMGNDLTNLIRRNPIPAVFVGIGIGYLLARATTRS
jgi:hypothetical protein